MNDFLTLAAFAVVPVAIFYLLAVVAAIDEATCIHCKAEGYRHHKGWCPVK